VYPSLYYAIKDLFGWDIPFFKMIQSFGFFVAIAFLTGAYFWTKELKRKEKEGFLKTSSTKILIGQKATTAELITSAIIGFLIGYKLFYVAFNFTAFTENTQGFLLSLKGNFIGGLALAAISVYMKYREKEKTKLPEPKWIEQTVHPYQEVGNLTLLAAFTGLLGAKIFHNLENWGLFMQDPIGSIFSFSGLTMYGGLICASIACIYYGYKKGITITHLIDTAAPSLMLSYAVGRIGCQVAGDGDWGIDNIAPKPSWLSWAPDWMWSYDYAHNVGDEKFPIPNCTWDKFCNHLVPNVFPTPFYETIMCLILFFILWKIRKRIKTPGVLFCIYLILNGIERFTIEHIRINTNYVIGGFAFTQAQLISSLLFFTGITGIFYFRKKKRVADLHQSI
jgi:phosphatidylglycerol---prolipoprotein diacylglyceryl transferase